MPESVDSPAPVSTAMRRPVSKATSSGDSARTAVTYSRVRTRSRAARSCRTATSPVSGDLNELHGVALLMARLLAADGHHISGNDRPGKGLGIPAEVGRGGVGSGGAVLAFEVVGAVQDPLAVDDIRLLGRSAGGESH